ncbi:MAG: hypothetical protein GQE15_39045 [Archangiaceae bacterium]|nr:hypothetical protein [Archangiaceae bacterium]
MLAFVVLVGLQAAPVKLVAPPWSVVRVEPDVAGYFAEHFEQELRARGFQVVTSRDVASILGLERQKQLLGCTDDGCAVELGNALGAAGLVNASVAHLGGGFRATFRVISSTDGHALAQASAEGDDEAAFLKSLTLAAASVAREFGYAPPANALLWLSTGAAVVLAAGSAIAFVVAKLQLDALDRELASFRMVTTRAENLALGGRAAEIVGWTAGGLAVGAGVAAIVAGLSGRAPAVAVVPSTSGAIVSYGGSW